MTKKLTRADLDTLTLSIGAHYEQEGAVCVMEYHTLRRDLPWGDDPADVSPVIRAFIIRLNDTRMPEGADVRARLLAMERAGRFDDTRASEAVEQRRAYVAADWAVRECGPLWLRAAGLSEQADTLAAVEPIINRATADAAAFSATVAADAATFATARVVATFAADAASAAADARVVADAARVATAAARVVTVATFAAPTRQASFDGAFACLERMLAITTDAE